MLRLVTSSLLLAALLVPGPRRDAEVWRAGSAAGIDSCTTSACHTQYRAIDEAHAPVRQGICKICHRPQPGDDHAFRLAQPGAALCTTCHHEIQAAGNTHTDLWPGGCTICHDPHGTGNPFMLSSAHVGDACLSCHTEIMADAGEHARVAGDACTRCHDPHGPTIDFRSPDEATRCVGCHETVREELESDHVHAPLRTVECRHCHEPHGSEQPANLRLAVPELCYECHDAIRERLREATHVHSVATEPGGCLVCHSAHGSSIGVGLRADPLTLCHGCHDTEVFAKDGRVIPPVALEIETSRYLHGPVEQHDCGACHELHGSNEPRLLIDRYEAEFYAPFDPDSYKLCFSCHPLRKVLTARSTNLTQFRNGSLNLHYLHVNKKKQGRTCRACHATHGSDAPKHIRSSVPFGEWQLPIEFTKTPTGGSCNSGCHPPRGYDREAPVDNAAPSPIGGTPP